jgi:hypothetical protein
MSEASTVPRKANPLRYAGYFAWFIGALVGLHALAVIREEYIAVHQWPIATGDVISGQHKLRRNPSTGSRSIEYFASFTVEFDPPLDQCGPGMLVTTVGGPTRCMGTIDTLPGSSDRAYEWIARHPNGSHIRVHYEPAGSGVRFVGESIADVYPWKEIYVILIGFIVGYGVVLLARRQDQLAPDTDSPPDRTRSSADSSSREELIDLNLR